MKKNLTLIPVVVLAAAFFIAAMERQEVRLLRREIGRSSMPPAVADMPTTCFFVLPPGSGAGSRDSLR